MNKTKNTPAHNLTSFKKALPFFGVFVLVVLISIIYIFTSHYISEQNEKQKFRNTIVHLELINKSIDDSSLTPISPQSDNKNRGICLYSAFELGWGCRTSIGFTLNNGSSPDTYVSKIDKAIMNTGYFKKTYESKLEVSYSPVDSSNLIACTLRYYSEHQSILMECWGTAQKSWYPNSEPEYSTAPGKDAWRE